MHLMCIETALAGAVSQGPLTITDLPVRGCAQGKPANKMTRCSLPEGNGGRGNVSPSNLIKANSFIKLLWLPSHFFFRNEIFDLLMNHHSAQEN